MFDSVAAPPPIQSTKLDPGDRLSGVPATGPWSISHHAGHDQSTTDPEAKLYRKADGRGLRRRIEIALLRDDVRVVLQLDGLAERERDRRRAQKRVREIEARILALSCRGAARYGRARGGPEVHRRIDASPWAILYADEEAAADAEAAE